MESTVFGSRSATAYLSHLDMRVFYGVRVAFDQLFNLPQVGLLDFLKLLHTHTHTQWERQKDTSQWDNAIALYNDYCQYCCWD